MKNIFKIVKKFTEDGKTYDINNVTFAGEDLQEHLRNTDGHAVDPRVHLVKKFLRHLPKLMSMFPKVLGMPKLTEPDAVLLQGMRDTYVDRAKRSEAIIQSFLEESRKQGMDVGGDWEARHFIEWVEVAFDTLTVIVEGDPYYRDRFFDFVLMIWQMGEKLRIQYGDDWMNKVLDERQARDLDVLQGWANERTKGKNIKNIEIDLKNCKAKVEVR
ncbi:hypothetical protein CMI37_19940 [Candidatus Pacearchaeota archaeon]|nr:hypothetical protein [Candidatus Pacearchaeota archaeon]